MIIHLRSFHINSPLILPLEHFSHQKLSLGSFLNLYVKKFFFLNFNYSEESHFVFRCSSQLTYAFDSLSLVLLLQLLQEGTIFPGWWSPHSVRLNIIKCSIVSSLNSSPQNAHLFSNLCFMFRQISLPLPLSSIKKMI